MTYVHGEDGELIYYYESRDYKLASLTKENSSQNPNPCTPQYGTLIIASLPMVFPLSKRFFSAC